MPVKRTADVTGVPRSVTKALRLLSIFTETRPDAGLTEVAAAAGLPKGTAHRLLLALEQEGFVMQDPENRKWSIGFRIAGLYDRMRQKDRLLHVCTPLMQRLRDEVQETICLTVPDGPHGICIERVDPDRELRLQTAIGVPVPLHAGASRKLILAFLPEARREQFIVEHGLRALTPRTVVDPQRLRDQLAEIRQQGYSLSTGEHNADVAAVAVGLHDVTGEVRASLSIAGPLSRFSMAKAEDALPRLQETAAEISRRLGYQSGT